MRSIVLLCLLQGVCSNTAPIQNDVNPDATSFCADCDQAEDSDQVTLLQRATQQSQLMAPGDEAAMDKDWEDLTQDEQDAAAKLGFTQDNWNVDQPSEWPDSKWQNVSEEKRKALETLGYDQEAWDEDKENIKLDKQELIQESPPTEIEEESEQPPAHHLLLQAGHRRPLPSRSLPAPHYARCGFENADGCGIWLQEDRDDFSWKTRSGRTPTAGTGPGGAHEGSKYFYIEASSIRSRFVESGQRRQRKGNTAVLRAITGKVTAGAYMEFWYHMFGSGIGALQVFARDSSDYTRVWLKYLKYQKKDTGISELWKKSGDQSNKWHKARIDLSKYAGSAITLWFMGVVGDASNDKGDIAIDDVTLFSGGAKPNAPAPTPAPMNYKAVLLATSRSCGAKSVFVGRFMGRGGLETCAKTVAGFGGKYFQFGKSCKTGSCYVEWSSADNCPHGRGRKKGLYWSRMYNFYKIQAPAPAPAPTLAPTPAPLASQATTESPGAAVSAVYGRIDSDNSGIINRAEWNKALADGILRVKTPGTGTTAAPSSASALFARIDKDKTGIISKDELNKAIANGIIKVPR